MTDHSPGPWSFDGPRDNIHVRQASDPNMRVCFMTSDGPTRENARLIAAAPDMLAALKGAMVVIDTFTVPHAGLEDAYERRRQAILTAIAKAEGTQR